MDSSVWIALIGSIATIMVSAIMPMLTTIINNRQKNLERAEDRAYQEKTASDLKLETAKAAADIKLETTKVAQVAHDSRQNMSEKLDVIHNLVNGRSLETLHRELATTSRELALRRELNDLKLKSGVVLRPIDLAQIELINNQVKDLNGLIAAKTTEGGNK